MQKVRLDQVAIVEISGIDKKTKPGQHIVRLCNFTDVYYNWAITSDLHDDFMIASASEKEIASLSLHRGQVALTKDSETRDDIGISTYIADDFDDVVLGYHTALITPDETKLNGKYLNAFLHTPYMQKYFAFNASGSGQRYTLSTETLNAIQLILPPIEEQEKIGNLFSVLDRKITLNRSINKELEQMAKEIYDYWFVQFDFPDENGRPYKSAGGAMVYNPILKREIPEGWYVTPITSLCKIVDCLHSKKPDFSFETEDSYMLITENLTKDGYVDISSKFYISCNDYKTWTKNIEVKEGDFLITNAGRAGDMCMVTKGVKAAIGRNITAIRPISIDCSYLKYYFKSLYTKEQIMNGLDVGSFFFSFNVCNVKKLFVLVPPKDIISKYTSISSPITKLVDNYFNNNCELNKAIKKFLPLLMTGQAKIK